MFVVTAVCKRKVPSTSALSYTTKVTKGESFTWHLHNEVLDGLTPNVDLAAWICTSGGKSKRLVVAEVARIAIGEVEEVINPLDTIIQRTIPFKKVLIVCLQRVHRR